jgi:Flavin containing amine oxidoreductase
MHAEAGGDLIDDDQEEIRKLAKELGLHESRILHGGFSHYRLGNDASFPPSARRVLALPWKRVFFAGEHTSKTWQGYMNGPLKAGSAPPKRCLRAPNSLASCTKE